METSVHSPLFWLAVFAASQLVLFFGREPLQRGLRAAGDAVFGALRLVARSLRGAADLLEERNREVLLEAARAETERRVERELTKVQEGFARHLTAYPALHQRLDAGAVRLLADLEQSSQSPPDLPGWPEAARAIAALPQLPEKSAQRVLDEIKSAASDGHKRALKEYQGATAQRHKVLAGLAPVVRELRQNAAQALKVVSAALETAGRVDAHVEQYQKIAAGNEVTRRKLAADHAGRFVVALLVMAVALGGAFVNFQLIALPMSELVPATTRVAGVSVAQVAALVIVLMEAAAGVFMLEALGVTELLPRVATLSKGHRRLILGIALVGLIVLSCIEASLAILREQMVVADLQLKQALAGVAQPEVAKPMMSAIPVVGQAVLGLVLPWVLAMIAIPLESLVASGRVVVGGLVVSALRGVGAGLRVVGWGVRKAIHLVGALLDLYVAVPLALERWLGRRGAGREAREPRPPRDADGARRRDREPALERGLAVDRRGQRDDDEADDAPARPHGRRDVPREGVA